MTTTIYKEKIEHMQLRNANEFAISDLQDEMRIIELDHKIERSTRLLAYKKTFLSKIQMLVKLSGEINGLDKEIDDVPSEIYCDQMYEPEFDETEFEDEDENEDDEISTCVAGPDSETAAIIAEFADLLPLNCIVDEMECGIEELIVMFNGGIDGIYTLESALEKFISRLTLKQIVFYQDIVDKYYNRFELMKTKYHDVDDFIMRLNNEYDRKYTAQKVHENKKQAKIDAAAAKKVANALKKMSK